MKKALRSRGAATLYKYTNTDAYQNLDQGESSIPLLSQTMPHDKFLAGSPDDKLLAESPTLSAVESNSGRSSQNEVVEYKKPPWWSYIWVRNILTYYGRKRRINNIQDYEPTRTFTERAFIHKLDSYLLTILCLGYFIKNLDQTNISNAYVSGMKEALHMDANQLNLIDVAWTTGYVIGQLPSQLILTKVRPSIWIPSCELVWTLLTLCLAGATTSGQVIGIRFFVGLVESIFYPAAHFLIGSWCMFTTSSSVPKIVT